ncbi:TauD/TfdA family dioxygenase [Streptomyces sp. NPDC006430]|uniref:TauD/TfdA family dioxygenase n=1 Tax=Streptomyces sp. NPDC006430 TaxID=3154299 RepID=UPI0033A4CA6C
MTASTEMKATGKELPIVLDDRERSEVRALAAELTNVPPRLVDDAGWIALARERSCALPLRLRQRLRRFRGDPDTDGLLHIQGLPVDPGRPTPVESGSVERHATAPASVLVLNALQLGEIVAFRAEKSGALVQNVVPVPGQESQQSNAGSTPLKMHVENAFHPNRPDFVALLCLRADHERKAGLEIASIKEALPLVSRADREVLSEPRFRFDPPPSFNDALGASASPVLTGAPEDPDIRVDFASTHPLDDRAGSALAALEGALCAVRKVIVLAAGDLAIIDNRASLHGRTAFTPRYDGHDRWLQRTFIHLDDRRSRAARVNDGRVLS